MAAIEIFHKIVMDNSGFLPNQTHQVEEDGTSSPLKIASFDLQTKFFVGRDQ